jgi:hypothetical protein
VHTPKMVPEDIISDTVEFGKKILWVKYKVSKSLKLVVDT